jgi:hypothetical protein
VPAVIKKDRNSPLDADEQGYVEKNIGELNEDQKNGIFDILKEYIGGGTGEVIEFELDALPPAKARDLKDYIEKCIKEKERKIRRKE